MNPTVPIATIKQPEVGESGAGAETGNGELAKRVPQLVGGSTAHGLG